MERDIEGNASPSLCYKEVSDERSPLRQASDDIPLEFIESILEPVDMSQSKQHTVSNCAKRSENSEDDLLTQHILTVHASHCEGCRFLSNTTADAGHYTDAAAGRNGRTYLKKYNVGCLNGCVTNNLGPSENASQGNNQQPTRAIPWRNKARGKPIPAPITMPPHSTHTTPNHTFDYENRRSSTPRSTTSPHMQSFDSSDPGQDDCQRIINTPPPAVLHHDWKTEVIFPQQTDCNSKVAAGVTVFMALALLLGIIAFMVVFFATRENTTDRIEPIIQEAVRIGVVLKINLTYKEEYGDSSSQLYRALHTNMTHMMDNIFLASEVKDVYQTTAVTGFRPGSVYIDGIVSLSTLPKDVADVGDEITSKELIKKLIFDIISTGVKSSAVVQLLRIKMEAIYILSVALDSTAEPDSTRTQYPFHATTGDSKTGRTDGIFVEVKYHELLNQEQCGTTRSSSVQFRIVGGRPAPAGKWPWIGSIDYAILGHKCAASLIAPKWAVTAAHCLAVGRDAIIQNITFGDTSLNSPSQYHQEVPVARIYSHPGSNALLHFNNDIAVLKLAEPVRISNGHVRPVCLETDDTNWREYKKCFITGWGMTKDNARNISNKLQEAEVPLVSRDVCSEQYRQMQLPNTWHDVTDNMICAGTDDGSVDSCQSDSGGPLVCQRNDGKWHLVGVTSFGNGCGNPDYSGVYARVSRYWNFITSIIDGELLLNCELIQFDTCTGVLPYTHTYDNSYTDHHMVIEQLLDNSTNTAQYTGTLTFEDYRLLVCSLFLPRCNVNGQSTAGSTVVSHLVPCQEFCLNVQQYIEINNLSWSYIFLYCESYPLAGNTSTKLCETKQHNRACGVNTYINVSLQEQNFLQSPNFPNGDYGNFLDCSWFVTTTTDTYVLIKFIQISMPICCDVLRIGEGSDVNNRLSVKRILRGDSQMRPIVVEANHIWIRLQSDETSDSQQKFYVEFHAISVGDWISDFDPCQSSAFSYLSGSMGYPSWWRCDGVADCATNEDEDNCNATTEMPTSSTTKTIFQPIMSDNDV